VYQAGSAKEARSSTAPLFCDASEAHLDRPTSWPAPGGRPVELGGIAWTNGHSVEAITCALAFC
jgi:RND superfamily putative drug exporter